MSNIDKKLTYNLLNSDPKSHSAYKYMMNTTLNCTIGGKNNETITSVKSAYQDLKNNQHQLIHPFGVSEKRFLWQNHYNKHKSSNLFELNGTMTTKKCVKNSFDIESFYDLSQELPCDRNRCSSETYKNKPFNRNKDSSNIIRVLNPSAVNINLNFKETTYDYQDKPRNKRVDGYDNLRFSAVGGLTKLLNLTPDEFPISKRFKNASFDTRLNIFSEEYQNNLEPQVKKKKQVDPKVISFDRKDFAGVRPSSMPRDFLYKSKKNNNSQKQFNNYLYQILKYLT
jgi:hypothetical protein